VVLAVAGAEHDRARHFVVAEAHVAQQVVDEQLEAVAVLAVAVERLAERGPVVDGPVGR
jgi:hypothetical protein